MNRRSRRRPWQTSCVTAEEYELALLIDGLCRTLTEKVVDLGGTMALSIHHPLLGGHMGATVLLVGIDAPLASRTLVGLTQLALHRPDTCDSAFLRVGAALFDLEPTYSTWGQCEDLNPT